MSWQNAPRVTPTKPAKPKSSSWKAAPKVRNERSWLDTAGEAIQNIPSSGVEFVKGIAEAVTSPVQTASSLLDLAAGSLNRAMPAPVRNFINKLDTDPEATKRAVRTAQQVGGFYKQRYGSEEALKRTIAKDPVGAVADLSTILSGGAGVVRAGGKVVAKVAPKVAPKATRVANAMTRAAEATNPINALAVPARKAAAIVQRAPVAAQQFVTPKQTAYLEAAEGRAPEIIAQLRAAGNEMVPGSKPTAAQAASPLGITQFSALGASAAKAQPTMYLGRETANDAARLNAMRGIAGTPDDIAAAIAAREAATDPLYKAAEARKFLADPKLMMLADDPYIKQAMPEATRLSQSQGITFNTNPTLFLHNVKISLDAMLAKTGETAIARGARSQVMDVRNRLINWLETKAPEYGAARTTFAEKSKPINQMEVGQYLEGKLTSPLEGGAQRANVFATAVRDAPGTIRRATTNEARFKSLTDVLTPDQVSVVMAIRDDLARAEATKTQARLGAAAAPDARTVASAGRETLRAPQLMNRVATIANDIWSRLQGKIDRKLAIQIATEMLDPEAAAMALEKAVSGQARAEKVGAALGAGARATGRGIASQGVLAAERAQNAMFEDIPDIDPDTGEYLQEIAFNEDGTPYGIYGPIPPARR